MPVASPPEPTTSITFRAMGTSAHVVIFGPADAIELASIARTSIEDLERLWSRFLPDSDTHRVNRAAGRPVMVDRRTVDLLSCAIEGWVRTGGSFDPTVGGSVRAAGYDHSFDELAAVVPGRVQPAPTPIDVVVHPMASTITVPTGVELDFGGIGKGAAADLTVRALLEAGAEAAMVNLGGDLRADGRVPVEGWHVHLDCPGSPQHQDVRIGAGAVCTSSTVKRRWRTQDGDRHHLIDPGSGRSTGTDLRSATVIGARATQCEILATAAIGLGLAGATQLIESHDACGLLVDRDGALHAVGSIEDFR